eukprot:6982730-Prymnesium_polylepis.2
MRASARRAGALESCVGGRFPSFRVRDRGHVACVERGERVRGLLSRAREMRCPALRRGSLKLHEPRAHTARKLKVTRVTRARARTSSR